MYRYLERGVRALLSCLAELRSREAVLEDVSETLRAAGPAAPARSSGIVERGFGCASLRLGCGHPARTGRIFARRDVRDDRDAVLRTSCGGAMWSRPGSPPASARPPRGIDR